MTCFVHTMLFRQVQTPCLSKYLLAVSIDQGTDIQRDVPLLITFFSAHHSPNTVNKNASEFVIGTVKLNSAPYQHSSPASVCNVYSPAFPINTKNHTLPVTFNSNGTAYAGRLNTPITAYHIPSTFFFSHELRGSESAACVGGV